MENKQKIIELLDKAEQVKATGNRDEFAAVIVEIVSMMSESEIIEMIQKGI